MRIHANDAEERPNPGSDEALDLGCTCPVMDNAHGLGACGSRDDDAVFWISGDCPLHGAKQDV